MPERYLLDAKHPRRAAYIMIFMALLTIALAIWVVSLDRRIQNAESIRRTTEAGAAARAALECRTKIAATMQANTLIRAMRDLSTLPQLSLADQLAGPLTVKERKDKEEALARYKAAEKSFHTFPLPNCVRSGP